HRARQPPPATDPLFPVPLVQQLVRGHLALQFGDVFGYVGEPFLYQDDAAGAVDVHQVHSRSQHVQLPPGGDGFRLLHVVYAAGGVMVTFFGWCDGAGGGRGVCGARYPAATARRAGTIAYTRGTTPSGTALPLNA